MNQLSTHLFQEDKMTEKYHEVFIPFPDVYNLGGAEVFKHLERSEESGDTNLVVIPIEFIERLDRLKESNGYSGGAEDVLSFLSKIDWNSSSPVHAYTGLDILVLDTSKNTNFSVIKLEEEVKKNHLRENSQPLLITNSELKLIKFQNRGLQIEKPNFLQINADIVNEGIIIGNDDLASALYTSQDNSISGEAASNLMGRILYPNQFIQFIGSENSYARIFRPKKGEDLEVRLLNPKSNSRRIDIGKSSRDNVWGIKPLDMEQYLALQYGLLNPKIELCFLCGSQGSGKTLLSYVSAIDQILWYTAEERKLRGMPNKKGGSFKQMVILKPSDVMGGRRRDPGALPGTIYEKMKPHLMPYIDSHKESSIGNFVSFNSLLKHPKFPNDFGLPLDPKIKNMKINGIAHLPQHSEAIIAAYSGFMRGRSISDSIFLIDEAQNFTPYELKTIIERMGEGSKAIIMGDPKQFDNPNCSMGVNGLTHAIHHYMNKDYSALIKLTKNYRSRMSRDSDSWRVFSSG